MNTTLLRGWYNNRVVSYIYPRDGKVKRGHEIKIIEVFSLRIGQQGEELGHFCKLELTSQVNKKFWKKQAETTSEEEQKATAASAPSR